MTILLAFLSAIMAWSVPSALAEEGATRPQTSGRASGSKASATPFLRGADVSFLPQLESLGVAYRDHGQRKDLLRILKDYGLNAIRLRVWHSPKAGWCGKPQTLAMARRVHDAGLRPSNRCNPMKSRINLSRSAD